MIYQEIYFSKYSGAGNDFILIDNRQKIFPANDPSLIAKLCHRHMGIGADGVILLNDSKIADFQMQVFNADGKEAEMCGNGIRCFTRFLSDLGFSQSSFKIETMKNCLETYLDGEDITTKMESPKNFRPHIILPIEGKELHINCLNTGVPHAVIFIDDIDNAPLLSLGPIIRHHPMFQPEGVNVNFAQIYSPKKVIVRTYERGIEGETMACGTGSTAVAIIGAITGKLTTPVEAQTRSKSKLTIDFSISESGSIDNVTMKGPALFVYRGIIPLARNSASLQEEVSQTKTS